MRLNKFLAKAGISSRRGADKLIQMATTEVNGHICIDPAYNVKTEDIVQYDGRRVEPEHNKIVVMLNKPKRVITTVRDPMGRKKVVDLIPLKIRLVPIGRLDQDTTGLLLLTNDGDLQQFLTHPKNQIPKDYEVIIDGVLKPSHIKKIHKGMYIGNKEYGKARIINQKVQKGRSNIVFRLKQGKKREIRRIIYYLGLRLISLKRIGYSKLKLGKLKEGEFRVLTNREIDSLQNN